MHVPRLDQTIGIGKRVIALDSKKSAARQFPEITELPMDLTGERRDMEPVASSIPSASCRAAHKSASDNPVIPPTDPANGGSAFGSDQVKSGPRPMDGLAASFGPFRLLAA